MPFGMVQGLQPYSGNRFMMAASWSEIRILEEMQEHTEIWLGLIEIRFWFPTRLRSPCWVWIVYWNTSVAWASAPGTIRGTKLDSIS